MPRIKLFLMRHSKSCSNHVREEESDDGAFISKGIRDPALSVIGTRNARRYGPVLRKRLASDGFDTDKALIAASTLRRAQLTAFLVFGRSPRVVPWFAENGQIPENTPEGRRYTAPKWSSFLAHLSTQVGEGDSVIIVGHGSYLRSLWPRLTGSEKAARLNNLDGILLDATISASGLRVHSFKEIPYTGPAFAAAKDQCSTEDTRKIEVLRRGMNREHNSVRNRKTIRKQRGGNGCAGMPLAYFQDGAQMKGTFGEQTGVGLANPTANWVRPPLSQTGGFSPSIMGAFATNGARLIPVAAYMGYKMYTNKTKKKKKSRRSRGTRRR
jgi:phosphohistidine phosphatase SixA